MLDMGAPRFLRDEFTKTMVGTPAYLSPELVAEEPYNCSSDIWALGVVLYEMMALQHPFTSKDMPTLMQKITDGADSCPCIPKCVHIRERSCTFVGLFEDLVDPHEQSEGGIGIGIGIAYGTV